MTPPLAYGNQTTKTKASVKPVDTSATVSIGVYVAEESTGDDFKLFEYDGLNQLVKVTEGSKTNAYTYNVDGLRSSKTVNGVTTTHIWDGDQIALELNSAGAQINKYVRGINLIYSEEAGGVKKYYLYNGHGDVVQLTGTDGNVTKVYDYDAFGNEKSPDPNDSNVFRYCGEYFDKETGTIYLRARYYDPEIGRFITEDSYHGNNTDSLSLNLYTYCSNNPVLYLDYSGNNGTIAEELWKFGEFIVFTTARGYTFLKKASPVGVFTWILATPNTSIALEDLSEAQINEIRAQNGLPPLPNSGVPSSSNTPQPPKTPQQKFTEWMLKIGATATSIQSYIDKYGIEKYSKMEDMLKGLGLNAHHIIPQRFANIINMKVGDMKSFAIPHSLHIYFTEAWRNAIPYGTTPQLRTIYEKALQIYKDFPDLIKIVERAMEVQGLK